MNYKKIATKRGIKVIYNIIKYIIVYYAVKIEFMLIRNTEEIWLITERQSEARDNGYHMFKYIREKYPNIKVYYAIDKKSPDRSKISGLGNILKFGSIKHYRIYFKATKHISTHLNGYMPNEKACVMLSKIFKINAKKVFLQHGVIKDFMKQCCKSETDLDLFVCGAYPEYKFVRENFGYDDNEVKYLGLARFDLLHTFEVKKQILFMPTFRMNLFMYDDDNLSNEKERRFLESEYYKRYQSLLNSEKLNNILNYYDIDFVFYPHYEIQKYIHLFYSDSSRVIIANKKNYDVQQLLKESAILITDYSSVYFDFAYMKKPIIYYQFDYKYYRDTHYSEGYFSYNNNGFGKIVIDECELIKEIEKIIINRFKMLTKYENRVNDFFRLYDENNRFRIFEEIRNL